jgi:hypothetical protein
MKNLLIELHQDKKLIKPLLGLLKSSFCIYRQARDNDGDTKIGRSDQESTRDIYCEFQAEIYPNLSKREKKLSWEEIIGTPPKDFRSRDRHRPFSINLERFHASIARSVDEQLKNNAKRRAVAILQQNND